MDACKEAEKEKQNENTFQGFFPFHSFVFSCDSIVSFVNLKEEEPLVTAPRYKVLCAMARNMMLWLHIGESNSARVALLLHEIRYLQAFQHRRDPMVSDADEAHVP